MTYKVNFSRKAFIDLEAVVDFYADKSNSTARKYYLGIMSAVEKLSEYPEIGRFIPELLDEGITKYRELIYEHYRIVYRFERNSKECIVLRIVDSRSLFQFEV